MFRDNCTALLPPYLRHSFDYNDPYLLIFLTLLGNWAAHELATDPTLETREVFTFNAVRSTWVLAVKGLHDQGQNLHLASVIYKILRGRGTKEDTELLSSCVDVKDLEVDYSSLALFVRSEWPLPCSEINKDPSPFVLDNLVKEYEAESFDGASASS